MSDTKDDITQAKEQLVKNFNATFKWRNYLEPLVGLTRGFLYAGARSLVVSLWRVNDESTSILMERFYRFMQEGKSRAEALRLAKLSLKNDPDRPELNDPFHWAPFILVGEGW